MNINHPEMTVIRVSSLTGKASKMTIRVDPKDILKWQEGEYIQKALWYLTPDEREFIKSGITPEEWETLK